METYTAAVENGMATVTVDSLSPFAIFSTGVAVPDTIVTDPPKTGDSVSPLPYALLALAVCGGCALIYRRKLTKA